MTQVLSERCVGRTYEILVEGPSKMGDTFQGRTTHNRIVHASAVDDSWIGEFAKVKIVRTTGVALVGEWSEAATRNIL